MLRRFTSPSTLAFATAIAATILVLAQTPSSGISASAQPTPFPSLAVLPTPVLPDWIAQISPIGPAVADSQVRVRFKQPLIALEAIESADQQRALDHFELEPNVPGAFRFLTPRLVGFEPDRQLPLATNFHVRIKRGLTDLAGHMLTHDVVWSFSSDEIALGLPAGDHFSLTPSLTISSNAELALSSLRSHVSISTAGHAIAPIVVVVASPGYAWRPEPESSTGPQGNDDWTYQVQLPKLARATRYDITVAPGVIPQWGNVAAKGFASGFETYEPLEFMGLGQTRGYNEQGGPLFITGTQVLDFNNEIREGSELQTIHVRDDAGRDISGGSTTIDANALRPATHYVVTIDPAITDVFGQQLGAAARAEFSNGDYSPDFWAPFGLHIIAAGSDLGIHFAAINVPSNTYALAYRSMRPEDLVYFASAEPSLDDPRQRFSQGLLPVPDDWPELPVRGPRNTSLDIALPVRRLLAARFGALAYGTRASTYEYRDYQGHYVTMRPTYYGIVQITDLGVFAFVLPKAALVRVHRLSDGLAVGGAQVSLYVAHDGARERPLPTPCAAGVTDVSGTAFFDAPAVAACLSGTDAPRLLALVRSGEDWAFVRLAAPQWGTSWEGGQIEPRGAIFPTGICISQERRPRSRPPHSI